MRWLAFANRNGKEILRDPLSAIFGVGFPVVLLGLIVLMKNSANIPNEMFAVGNFGPAMAVFGLSFLAMFLAMLITSDKQSSFLARLLASPLTTRDFLLGYALPLVPVALLQSLVCLLAGVALGLTLRWYLLAALLALVPVALLFISIGLVMGSLFSSSQQVGGAGSVMVNVCAWLSGTWFDPALIGGPFQLICQLLPFYHAVQLVTLTVNGDFHALPGHLAWVLGYTAAFALLAVALFRRRMRQ